MYGYVACIYICVPYVCLVLGDVRRRYQIPGNGVTNDCEPPYRCWELNHWAISLSFQWLEFLVGGEHVRASQVLTFWPLRLYLCVPSISYLTRLLWALVNVCRGLCKECSVPVLWPQQLNKSVLSADLWSVPLFLCGLVILFFTCTNNSEGLMLIFLLAS